MQNNELLDIISKSKSLILNMKYDLDCLESYVIQNMGDDYLLDNALREVYEKLCDKYLTDEDEDDSKIAFAEYDEFVEMLEPLDNVTYPYKSIVRSYMSLTENLKQFEELANQFY